MKYLSTIAEWQWKNFGHFHSEILLDYTSCRKALCVIYVKSRFPSLPNCKAMALN